MPLKLHPRLELDISWRDLWFALTAGGKSLAPEPSLHAIHKAFPNRPVIATLSVRSAFLGMLQALKPKHGAEVLMSAVNIENMADIVRACGLTPVSVDIDLATLAPTPDAVRARITDRTIIYLHAHLYGSRNPLASFASICRARNVLLVEDCAQAYDGAAFKGSSEADASLFSFGPIKPATTLGGAILRLRDPDLHARIVAELANWPEQENKAITRRARKLGLLKFLSGPHRYAAIIALMRARGADIDAAIGAAARGFKPGDLLEQIMKRPSPRLLALMARRLTSPPDNSWRRTAAERLHAALRSDIIVPGRDVAAHAYWLFPILAENSGEIIAALRHEGFDATRGATSMRVTAGGSTPNAVRLIEQVVYLPLSPALKTRDIDRMAGVVNALAARQPAKAA